MKRKKMVGGSILVALLALSLVNCGKESAPEESSSAVDTMEAKVEAPTETVENPVEQAVAAVSESVDDAAASVSDVAEEGAAQAEEMSKEKEESASMDVNQ
ncbi:MAG: hypothetical protein JKY66_09075 [Spongiibacteraceae bacterium]|nr:hypothetical protein [Spongiibacteraceae bacterium]